jgi:hypothetical protein
VKVMPSRVDGVRWPSARLWWATMSTGHRRPEVGEGAVKPHFLIQGASRPCERTAHTETDLATASVSGPKPPQLNESSGRSHEFPRY